MALHESTSAVMTTTVSVPLHELGVECVVDVGAGDVGVEAHVSELERIERVAAKTSNNNKKGGVKHHVQIGRRAMETGR